MSLANISRKLGHHLKNQLTGTFYRTFAVQNIDVSQEAALDEENCILVDEADNTIGSASKRMCHIVGANGEIPLHRAFSVFLFNTKGEMLMQRRGNKKVTFPNVYANACCSHPLWIGDKEEDIFLAAQRRLNYELGIPVEQISPTDFNLLTRIHYHHAGDGKWGEHEIDYILFLQKDVYLDPNPDEITEVCYVQKEKLDETLSKFEAPISPWFKLIHKHRLQFWWNNLNQLHLCEDKNVHKLT
ncbi:isopentenyl-diphosphate delta isomerase [Arctopsyche grandis]|uniref:isopentenyl-diphosphate delta isomerase n=1 Tax=Arctopsyche grandis TaxID=121162 RepID=UPI00406D6DF1